MALDPVVLDRIPLQLPLDDLLERLHVPKGSEQVSEVQGLVREAEAVARPKALCGIAYVDDRGDDYVVIDGVRFASRVLAVNLEQTHRVFPYVATSGAELEEWAEGLDDMLHSYWSETIRLMALYSAMKAATDFVDETYRPGETSRMNPGSLPDWPLTEQVPLFQLMGDPGGSVGVQLSPSLLMLPTKSVSGISFATTTSFESCMLCPRPVCLNRRAPHDPELYARRFTKG